MAGEVGKRGDDSSNWWWVFGVVLLLAYCNYSGRDQRAEPAASVSGMSARELTAYRDCMKSTGSYNLPGSAQSDICRKSALGLDDKPNCRTDWDGRQNPTTCE